MTADDLLPDILPYVPGCPRSMVERAVRATLQEWCRETEIWKSWLPPVLTEAGRLSYVLNAERHAQAVRTCELKINGDDVPLQSEGADVSGLAQWAVADNAGRVVLYADPGSGLELTARCVLAPADDATEFDDQTVRNWRRSIIDGTLARLLEVPKQEWTDQSRADTLRSRFKSDMYAASRDAADGFQRPMLRVKPL